MNRNLLLSCIVVLCSLASLSSFAQAERYIAGTLYTVLEASVRTADAETIEALEIFWHACLTATPSNLYSKTGLQTEQTILPSFASPVFLIP